MKLKEIKDIKPNQIYKHKNGNIYIVSYQTHYRYEIADCYKDNILYSEENEFYSREFAEDMRLIGFIGITHKLEYKNLVEIPREEFEVDDIVEAIEDITEEMSNIECNIKKGEKFVILYRPYHFVLFGIDNEEKSEFCFCGDKLKKQFKKIGIYGVTHTFINDKLEEYYE